MHAAARLHGDDTTVPVLAKGRTITGRLWAYVRDDRPFAGGPPAVAVPLLERPPRRAPQQHLAGYPGILQADAYAGFGELYAADPSRRADHRGALLGPCTASLLRARRPQPGRKGPPSPLALEAVRRIDAIFAHERSDQRPCPPTDAARLSARALGAAGRRVEDWLRRATKLSRHAEVAKAIDYMLKRWPAFTRFLDDGRICLTNNAAERALRGVALGRKSWLFCGSDRGGDGRPPCTR